MFPFIKPKPVLVLCYCLAHPYLGVNSTSAACTCTCQDFHFKVQTILILKRLFPQWEYELHELLTFLFHLLIVYDNTFRSLYNFFFFLVSITVGKMSVEVKVESVHRERERFSFTIRYIVDSSALFCWGLVCWGASLLDLNLLICQTNKGQPWPLSKSTDGGKRDFLEHLCAFLRRGVQKRLIR